MQNSAVPASMLPEDISVPCYGASVGSPFSWLRDMTANIRDQLLVHGAVLIRGLPMDGPDRLAAARDSLGVGSFTPTEAFNRRGDFGDGITSPIAWPLDRHICPIQESSFSGRFPTVVLTACVTPPDGDGMAHLGDARRLAGYLPAHLADRVRACGWTMTRAFHGAFGISWQDAFSVTDRAALDEVFEREAITSEWLPSGALSTVRRRPGFIDHPVTGEECWFNQIGFLNAGSMDQTERAFLTKAFGKHLPMNTFFGDGSPLSEEDLAAIDVAYDSVKVGVPWRRGDLLVTDNIAMALGRSAFEGSPEILVALGEW